MAETQRLICAGAELADGGSGVRFDVPTAHGEKSAFVIRHRGRVYGYVNRCAHVGVEMDWRPGEFFDDSGLYLICATHGAVYRPETGECVAGPCRGARLESLDVFELDGHIYLK